MRLQLHGIDIDLDLAILAAIGLGDRCSGNAGYLIAHGELGKIFELSLIESLSFKRHQADRQIRRVKAEHDGR